VARSMSVAIERLEIDAGRQRQILSIRELLKFFSKRSPHRKSIYRSLFFGRSNDRRAISIDSGNFVSSARDMRLSARSGNIMRLSRRIALWRARSKLAGTRSFKSSRKSNAIYRKRNGRIKFNLTIKTRKPFSISQKICRVFGALQRQHLLSERKL